MPTISIERQRIQDTTDWPLYRKHRARLADLFPGIRYSGQPKTPLAVGIKADLLAANTGLCGADICAFLSAYTFGPKYLRALKAGAMRIGLSGLACGTVTAVEAEHAAAHLRAHYSLRRACRVGLRAAEAAVAPDVEEEPYPYRFGRAA
jgi:sRNA-binding protein